MYLNPACINFTHDDLQGRDETFQNQQDLCWTMVNVNYSDQKGDAHVITLDNQINILIDAGCRDMAEKALLPFLQKNSIRKFDLVFISHAHKDHYGGLDVLLDNDITINQLFFNLPDQARCERETPWGCDYPDVLRIRSRLIDRGIKLKEARIGDKFDIGRETSLEILFASDGVNTPVGPTDINDSSLIIKLRHERFDFLFTGDLNEKMGSYLAAAANDINADILKVPHHAMEDLAPNAFFEKVAPRYAIVSAPKDLWLGGETERARNWFAENNIPVFVNGMMGDIQVKVSAGELKIGGADNQLEI